MRASTLLLASTLGLAAATPASADTICEWMEFAQKQLPQGAPPAMGLTQAPTGENDHMMTKVALAMFEAVNAIDHRYRSYVGITPGAASADQHAAAMTAAVKVLKTHPAARKTELEESYDLALAGMADSPAKAAGIALGKTAAAAVLKLPDVDPKLPQSPYRAVVTPGQWVPTALPATAPHSVAYRPWVLKRADEVRPAPPPALTSERYARDLDEVRRLGARGSTERTRVQTLMARYRITSNEMPAMRMVADQEGRRLVDNARLFALYGMLVDDLQIAMADGKLHHNFWRPVTAIRNADKDNNPATTAEPGWLPLMNTPNHGEYPCGHCLFAGGVAEMMSTVGGKAPAWGVRVGSMSLPNSAIQVLPDWNEWARQVSDSRILGGVHYRFSNEAGDEMGRKVARLTLERALQPLPAAQVRPAS
nr:vanadium-dependent haloperoxidase [uncultured Sphingomonas sp.]